MKNTANLETGRWDLTFWNHSCILLAEYGKIIREETKKDHKM